MTLVALALASCSSGGHSGRTEPPPADTATSPPTELGPRVLFTVFGPLDDGMYAATPDADPVWLDVRPGADGLGRPFYSVSPGTSRIAEWRDRPVVRVVDVRTGAVAEVDSARTPAFNGLAGEAVWSADERRVAWLSGGAPVIGIADSTDGRAIEVPAVGDALLLSPDGVLLLDARTSGADLQLVDAATGAVLPVPGADEALVAHGGSHPVFSPDGARLALITGTSGPADTGLTAAETRVRILDRDGRVYQDHAIAVVAGLGWSADGAWFSIAAHDAVWLFPADGADPVPVPLDWDPASGAAWSPVASELAVAAHGSAVRISADGTVAEVAVDVGSLVGWTGDGQFAVFGSPATGAERESLLIDASDWRLAATFGPGIYASAGPGSWLALDHFGGPTEIVAAAEPTAVTLTLPDEVRHWRFMDASHLAWIDGPTLMVAALDGTTAPIVRWSSEVATLSFVGPWAPRSFP